MRHWRNEIFWGTLALIVIVLNTWWFPSGTVLTTDSFSTSYSGKRVLYETLLSVNGFTYRSTDQLVGPDTSYSRLLILGPARYPDDGEWQELYGAVSSGMVLVFSSSAADPTFDSEAFGVSVERMSSFDDFEDGHGSDDSGDPYAQTELMSIPVRWRSGGTLVFDHPEYWDVLVEVDAQPQVAIRELGAGLVMFCASDDIFSNQSMVSHQKAILAHRILAESDYADFTLIDETLNSSGTPKVLGILFDPLFRPMTLQLILIAILFGWLGSRRFGAIEQHVKEDRRSIVEHVEAVGVLYDRSGANSHCVQNMFEYLNSHLRALMGSGARSSQVDVIAQRAQMKPEKVKRLFESIRQAKMNPISSSEAANLIRDMIHLIRQLYSLNDGEKGSKNVR